MSPAVRVAASLAIVGLIGILGQVVLLREIAAACQGSEVIWIVGIGVWLSANALGVWRGAIGAGARGRKALFYAAALVFPFQALTCQWFFPLFGIPLGVLPSFGLHLALVCWTMFPAGWLAGKLFRAGLQAWERLGGKIAMAYVIECSGGALGGILSAVSFGWGIQNSGLLAWVAFLAAAAGLLFDTSPAAALGRSFAALVMIVMGCWLGFNWPDHLFPSIDAGLWEAKRAGADRVVQRDSPSGRITRMERSGQSLLLVNHQMVWDSESASPEERVQLAALFHPHPKRMLLAGGVVDGVLWQALQHQPDRIDMVEMEPMLVRMAPENYPSADALSMGSAATRLILQDPRRFVVSTTERYDIIVSSGAEPDSGAANRFFTREFFAGCSVRLNPGGILSLSIPGSENRLSSANLYRLSAIYRALRGVFPCVRVFPGATMVFLASRSPIVLDMDAVSARYAERGIRSRYVHPAYIRYLVANDRFSEIGTLLSQSTASMNTDAMPVCYGTGIWLWLSRLYPRLAHVDPGWLFDRGAHWLWYVLAAIGALLPAGMRKRGSGVANSLFSVGLAGFAGMLLESLWLLMYQSQFGALYRDIGMLFMAFMAGMTVGGWLAVHREWGRRAERIAVALLGVGSLGCVAPQRGMDFLPVGMGLGTVGLVLMLVGGAVSVVVAVELGQVGGWDARIAIDGMAASLAAVLGGLIFIPFFGIVDSAFLLLIACSAWTISAWRMA